MTQHGIMGAARPAMSRREAFGTLSKGVAFGAAFGGFVSLSGTGVEAAQPDADLLHLGRELEAAWLKEADLDVRGAVSDEEADAIVDATGAIVERIIATPASTIEGVRVKLRAVLWCRNGDLLNQHTDEKLISALVSDLGVSRAPAWRL